MYFKMNIKTLATPSVTPLDSLKNTEIKKEMRSEESGDRDADGRREPSSGEQKEALTEEELLQVMQSLREIPGVKEHNLTVRHQFINNHYFFFLEDLQGKTIRRMSTPEAWMVVQSQDQKTGQLLNKTL